MKLQAHSKTFVSYKTIFIYSRQHTPSASQKSTWSTPNAWKPCHSFYYTSAYILGSAKFCTYTQRQKKLTKPWASTTSLLRVSHTSMEEKLGPWRISMVIVNWQLYRNHIDRLGPVFTLRTKMPAVAGTNLKRYKWLCYVHEHLNLNHRCHNMSC